MTGLDMLYKKDGDRIKIIMVQSKWENLGQC
jgi:hypothetical protein